MNDIIHFCANCRKQMICTKKEKHLTDERRYKKLTVKNGSVYIVNKKDKRIEELKAMLFKFEQRMEIEMNTVPPFIIN